MRNESARIGAALVPRRSWGRRGARDPPPYEDPRDAPTDTKDPKKDTRKTPRRPSERLRRRRALTRPPPPPPEPVETAPLRSTPPSSPLVSRVVTAPTPVPVAPRSDDEWDVTEKDAQKYYFVGLRYRGQLIPQAFINIFVDGGVTVWTNSVGPVLDIRKDGFSSSPTSRSAITARATFSSCRRTRSRPTSATGR